MQPKNPNGFVLITALIFLLMLALLVISGFEYSIIGQKIANNQRQQDALNLAAERMLHQLIRTIDREITHPPSLPALPDAKWWQKNATTYADATYQFYYFIEVLAEDACIHIMDAKVDGARFYRITVKAQRQREEDQIILQLTYVKATNVKLPCEGNKKILREGIQAWISSSR